MSLTDKVTNFLLNTFGRESDIVMQNRQSTQQGAKQKQSKLPVVAKYPERLQTPNKFYNLFARFDMMPSSSRSIEGARKASMTKEEKQEYYRRLYDKAMKDANSYLIEDSRFHLKEIADGVKGAPLYTNDYSKDNSYNLISDPNNPLQYNSFLDVMSALYKTAPQEGQALDTAMAVLNIGGGEFLHRTWIDPIKGMFSSNQKIARNATAAFFLNNLISFGETVDMLAGPVKALLPTQLTTAKNFDDTKNMSAEQRLAAQFGFGVNGRHSFNMDIDLGDWKGSGFAEFAVNGIAEVLVDPLNILELGGGLVLKEGSTAIMKSVLAADDDKVKNAIKLINKITGKDVNVNKLARVTAESFIKNDPDAFVHSFFNFVNRYAKGEGSEDLATSLAVNIEGIKKVGYELFNFARAATEQKVTMNILETLGVALDFTYSVDKGIIAFAGLPVFTPTVWLGKQAFKKGAKYVNRLTTRGATTLAKTSAVLPDSQPIISILDASKLRKSYADSLRIAEATGKVEKGFIELSDVGAAEIMHQNSIQHALAIREIIYRRGKVGDIEQMLMDVKQYLHDVHGDSISSLSELAEMYKALQKSDNFYNMAIGDEIIDMFDKLAKYEEYLETVKNKNQFYEEMQSIVNLESEDEFSNLSKIINENAYTRHINYRRNNINIKSLDALKDTIESFEKVIINKGNADAALSLSFYAYKDIYKKLRKKTKDFNATLTGLRRDLRYINSIIDSTENLNKKILGVKLSKKDLSDLKSMIYAERVAELDILKLKDIANSKELKYLRRLIDQIKEFSTADAKSIPTYVRLDEYYNSIIEILEGLNSSMTKGELVLSLNDIKFDLLDTFEELSNIGKIEDLEIPIEYYDDILLPELYYSYFKDETNNFLADVYKSKTASAEMYEFQVAIMDSNIPIFNKSERLMKFLSSDGCSLNGSLVKKSGIDQVPEHLVPKFLDLGTKTIKQEITNIFDSAENLMLNTGVASYFDDLPESLKELYTSKFIDLNDIKTIEDYKRFTESLLMDIEEYKDTLISSWVPLKSIRDSSDKVTQELLNESDRLKDTIDILNTAYRQIEVLNITKHMISEDGKAWAKLTHNEFMSYVQYINDPYMIKLHSLFDEATEEGRAISMYMSSISDIPEKAEVYNALVNMKHLAQYFSEQRELSRQVLSILQGDTNKWILFTDSFRGVDISNAHSPGFFDALFNKMEMNAESSFNFHSKRLDYYRTLINDPDDAVSNKILNAYFTDDEIKLMRSEGHDNPLSDTLMTKFGILRECPAEDMKIQLWKNDHPDQNAFIIDIETVSQFDHTKGTTNRNTGMISQICIQDYFTNKGVVFRLEDLPYAETKDVSSIINIPGSDDAYLLNAMDKYMRDNKCGYLVGANQSSFDYPFISTRWKAANEAHKNVNDVTYYGTSVFRTIRDSGDALNSDLRTALNSAMNLPTVSAKEREELEDLILNFAERSEEHGFFKFEHASPRSIRKDAKKVLDSLNTSLDNIEYKTLYSNDNVLVSNMQDTLQAFLEHTRTADREEFKKLDNYYIRDIWKETFDNTKATELSKLSSGNPEWARYTTEEDVWRSMVESTHLSEKQYIELLNGTADEATLLSASDWWRKQMLVTSYFQNHKNEIDAWKSMEQFEKVFFSDRTQMNSLRNFMFPKGTLGELNYRTISNPEAYSKFFKEVPIGTLRTEKQYLKFHNAYSKIDRLVNGGIKDAKAIFELGLFDNLDDIISSIGDFQNMFAKIDPEHWVNYVDLTKLTTPEEAFAVWNTIVNSNSMMKAIDEYFGESTSSSILYNGTRVIEVEGSDKAIISKIFKDSKSGIEYSSVKEFLKERILHYSNTSNSKVLFDAASENYKKLAYMQSPLDYYTTDPLWSTKTAMRRQQELDEAIMAFTRSDAKRTAQVSLEADIFRLAKKMDDMPIEERMKYYDNLRIAETIRNSRIILNTYRKALDPESFVAEVLFNNGIIKLEHLRYIEDVYGKNADMFDILNSEEYLKALDEAGLNMYQTDKQIIFTLQNKAFSPDFEHGRVSFNGKTYTAPEHEYIPYEYVKGVDDADIDTLNKLNTYTMEQTSYRGFGAPITEQRFYNMYESLPKTLQDISMPAEILRNGDFFKDIRFDTMRIFAHNDLEFVFSDAFNKVFESVNYGISNMKPYKLYLETIFNLGGRMDFDTEGFFKGLTDDQIAEFFNRSDCDLVALRPVGDSSFLGVHFQRLDVSDAMSVKLARQNNAVIVPYEIYSECFENVNGNILAGYKKPADWDWNVNTTEQAYDVIRNRPKYYLRSLTFLYKAGYLASFGTVFRNIIDSNFKAVLDTEDPIGMAKNSIKSIQLLRKFEKTIEIFRDKIPEAIEKGDFHAPKMQFSSAGYYRAFSYCKDKGIPLPMSEGEFHFIEGFLENGPSAGESRQIAKWIKSDINTSGKSEKTLGSLMTDVSGKLLTPMSWVEQHVRLSQYLTLMDHGVSTPAAFKKVADTAFNYSVKSKIDMFAEGIVPFYTFQKLNFMYWMKALENPVTVKLLDDIMGATWNTYNLSDITADEINANRSLQYYMSTGAIQMSPQGMLLKLNPSYLDAFNILLNPKEKVLSSIIAPLQNYLTYEGEDMQMNAIKKDLKDGTYQIGFGRLKGKEVSEFLKPDNKSYAQWLLTQEWFKTYYKPEYDYLVHHELYKNPEMPWGKFKGEKLSDVPQWYRDYMLQNEWFTSDYKYIADIWETGRNSVLPEEAFTEDTLMDFSRESGRFAAGIFDSPDFAKERWNNLASTFKDLSTYPILGVLGQRFLDTEEQTSTSTNNKERLSAQNAPVQATISSIFPTMFGSVKRWESFKEDSSYYGSVSSSNSDTSDNPGYVPKGYHPRYSKSKNPYAYSNRRYLPHRAKNMYYNNTNPTRNAAAFEQAKFKKLQINQAKFNLPTFRTF